MTIVDPTVKPTQDELLNAAYAQEATCGLTGREFSCLIALIEWNTINTWQALVDHGDFKVPEGVVVHSLDCAAHREDPNADQLLGLCNCKEPPHEGL